MAHAVDDTAALTEDREPAELDGEDVEEQDPGCERGRAHPEDAHRDDPTIGRTLPFQRGPHAERDADEQREQEGEEAELKREDEALAEHVDDRLVRADRAAEVEPDGAARPVQVLHEERVVEVVLGPDGRDRLGRRRPCAQEQLLRAPRGEVEQAEDDERDEDEQHHERGEAPGDEEREVPRAHLATAAPRPGRLGPGSGVAKPAAPYRAEIWSAHGVYRYHVPKPW